MRDFLICVRVVYGRASVVSFVGSLAIFILAGFSSATADTIQDSTPPLAQLVRKLAASWPLNRNTVESITGTKLAPADGSMQGGALFAKNIHLHDSIIELIDYREVPASEGIPARFLLLSLQISGACITRSSVGLEFGSAFGAPGSDASRYSNVYFHEVVNSVVVSFGFPLEGQDCLKLVIFNPDLQGHL